jgi:hypothetical protein
MHNFTYCCFLFKERGLPCFYRKLIRVSVHPSRMLGTPAYQWQDPEGQRQEKEEKADAKGLQFWQPGRRHETELASKLRPSSVTVFSPPQNPSSINALGQSRHPASPHQNTSALASISVERLASCPCVATDNKTIYITIHGACNKTNIPIFCV